MSTTGSVPARPVVMTRSLFDNNKNGDDFGDRIIAAIPFLLPLLDGLPYGKVPSYTDAFKPHGIQ